MALSHSFALLHPMQVRYQAAPRPDRERMLNSRTVSCKSQSAGAWKSCQLLISKPLCACDGKQQNKLTAAHPAAELRIAGVTGCPPEVVSARIDINAVRG